MVRIHSLRGQNKKSHACKAIVNDTSIFAIHGGTTPTCCRHSWCSLQLRQAHNPIECPGKHWYSNTKLIWCTLCQYNADTSIPRQGSRIGNTQKNVPGLESQIITTPLRNHKNRDWDFLEACWPGRSWLETTSQHTWTCRMSAPVAQQLKSDNMYLQVDPNVSHLVEQPVVRRKVTNFVLCT